jgi:hypothetical protein
MADVKNGGPAFPRLAAYIDCGGDDKEYVAAQEGMSLRDYFAGQALVGFMAHPKAPPIEPADAKKLAADSYDVADAMIAAREKSHV